MGFAEDGRDARGEGAALHGRQQLALVEARGVVAGEPVVGLAQQVVAHLAPVHEVEGLRVGPEAEDFAHVDFAGHVPVVRQALEPPAAPVVAQHAEHLGAQPGLDGGDGFRRAVVVREAGDVVVEVGGFRRAATEGVDLRAGEAVEGVELHGRERGAHVHELLRRRVEFPALVVGADDEDAHVEARGGFDGGPVEVVDEIPVDVEVGELAGVDGVEDDVGGGVGAEADVAAAALALELARGFEAAAFAEGPVEVLAVVDAVEGEEVHVVEPQILHGLVEGAEEFLGRGEGGDLGLDDEFVALDLREHPAELHLAGAVAARGLDVVNAELEGAVDGGFEVSLAVLGHLAGWHVLPLVLVAHAAAGEDGHLQLSLSEAAVFHARSLAGCAA